MIQAQLNAFPSDFHYDGRFPIHLDAPPPPQARPFTEIHDARALQAGRDVTAFFETHGFVLLPHDTAVTDWDAAVTDGYLAEVEALIRTHLLPGRTLGIPPFGTLIRRGAGTGNGYATGVHQDCGIGPDDFQALVVGFSNAESAAFWRAFYDRPDVERYLLIDIWRTTDMTGPLQHMPLALCDPNTVEAADIVPTEIHGVAPEGRSVPQMAVRRNPGQSWYYYPGMTGKEALAFKLFDCSKDDPAAMRSCFHTAFEDVTAPADAEPRRSCEFRAGVFVMRD